MQEQSVRLAMTKAWVVLLGNTVPVHHAGAPQGFWSGEVQEWRCCGEQQGSQGEQIIGLVVGLAAVKDAVV